MSYSRSPKLLKGSFVQIDSSSYSLERVIVFQYNPEKLDRRLIANESRQSRRKGRNRNKLVTPKITPRESIVFNLILDATDKLEYPEDNIDTAEHGIYSQLSAIEMLLYPKKSTRKFKFFLGIMFPKLNKNCSLTLFIWGNKRILPIHITKLVIVEDMFDNQLNPIRANIEVTMHVLNDVDFPRFHKGYEYWKSHLTDKILLAEKAFEDTKLSDQKTL